MAYDVDRRPGAWVRAQAKRRERQLWLGLAVGLVVAGGFVALALGHAVGIVGAAAFLAVFLAIRPFANDFVDSLANWWRGAHAEASVGETLNELRREGWIVMHDVEQEFEGNIDHIASGPNGVFLIETKDRRYEDDQLTKVKRQAAKLNKELGVWVAPVICLHRRRGAHFQTKGVAIVPQQHLLDWLREQRGKPVQFERLARYADRVD